MNKMDLSDEPGFMLTGVDAWGPQYFYYACKTCGDVGITTREDDPPTVCRLCIIEQKVDKLLERPKPNRRHRGTSYDCSVKRRARE